MTLQPLFHENVHMSQAITEHEQTIQTLTIEKEQVAGILQGIYQSRSWRWTEPLRKITTLFRW